MDTPTDIIREAREADFAGTDANFLQWVQLNVPIEERYIGLEALKDKFWEHYSADLEYSQIADMEKYRQEKNG